MIRNTNYTKDAIDAASSIVYEQLYTERKDSYHFCPKTVSYWKKALVLSIATGYVAIDRMYLDPDYGGFIDNMYAVYMRPTIAGLWLKHTQKDYCDILMRLKIVDLSKKRLSLKKYGCEFLQTLRQIR